MIRFVFAIICLCHFTVSSQLDPIKVVPINDPGDKWAQDKKGNYQFRYDNHQGAIIDAKSDNIIEWVRFTDRIHSVCFEGDYLLVQSEFMGCLYNFDSHELLYSQHLKGTVGLIDSRKSQIYVAYENNLHLPYTGARSILNQLEAINAVFKVVSLEAELLDSLPITVRMPMKISFKGDLVEIGGKMFYGTVNGGSKRDNYLKFETINLKERTSTIEDRIVTNEYVEEIKLPKPENWFHNCMIEILYHRPSGNLVVYGGGASEGGAVKAWNTKSGDFMWGISKGNDLNPLLGFSESGELYGYKWFESDTIPVSADYALMDQINDGSGNPQYLKVLTKFDLQERELLLLSKTDRDMITLDSLNTSKIDLDNQFQDSLIFPEIELYFDAGAMNFQVFYPPTKTLLNVLCFDGGTWMIHDKDGNWKGTANSTEKVNFVKNGKVLDESEFLKYKDEDLIKSYFPK